MSMRTTSSHYFVNGRQGRNVKSENQFEYEPELSNLERNLKQSAELKANSRTKEMNFLPNIFSAVGRKLLRAESMVFGEFDTNSQHLKNELIRCCDFRTSAWQKEENGWQHAEQAAPHASKTSRLEASGRQLCFERHHSGHTACAALPSRTQCKRTKCYLQKTFTRLSVCVCVRAFPSYRSASAKMAHCSPWNRAKWSSPARKSIHFGSTRGSSVSMQAVRTKLFTRSSSMSSLCRSTTDSNWSMLSSGDGRKRCF